MTSPSNLRVRKGPKIYGPLTREQLATLLAEGRFVETDLVSVNEGPWMPIAHLTAPPRPAPPRPVAFQAAVPAPPVPAAPPPLPVQMPPEQIVPFAPEKPPPAAFILESAPPPGPWLPHWKQPWVLGAAGLVLLVILGLAGWFLLSGAGFNHDLKFLPDHCHLIASVNLEALTGTPAYRDIREEVDSVHKDVEKEFKKAWGIPFDAVSRISIGSSFEDGEDSVVVIRTRKDITLNDILARKRDGNYKERRAGNYVVQEATGPESFCVADDRTVVYGRAETLDAILRRNGKPDLSPNMKNALKPVDFSEGVVLAADLQAGSKKRRLPFLALPGIPEGLADADTASLQIAWSSSLDLTATLTCADARAAEDLRKLLDGQLGKWGKTPGLSRDAVRMLDDVKLTTKDARLLVSLKVQPATVIETWRRLSR